MKKVKKRTRLILRASQFVATIIVSSAVSIAFTSMSMESKYSDVINEYDSNVSYLNGVINEYAKSNPLDSEHALTVCSNNTKKTWMPYTAITSQSSKQWHLRKLSYSDENGFRRFNEYYLVAMGTFYAKYIGQTFEITFEDGQTIKVMIGDVKSNAHTDATGCYAQDGSVLEFIVDKDKMGKDEFYNEVMYTYGDFDKVFNGSIVKIIP